MERERFDFTSRRDGGQPDGPSDESFDGTRTRIGNILRRASDVAHSQVTAHNESTLQQLQQRGAQ